MKKKLFGMLALAVMATAGLSPGSLSAQAAETGSCLGAGYLCFRDINVGWGNVSGDNKNWNDFGWNDRADFFWNRGRQCKVTIYQHEKYGGVGVVLQMGGSITWYDTVSSNRWCI